MTLRTPGRRYWESHWHIRLAGFIAISMLGYSVWFLYHSVKRLEGPHNPHYVMAHCFDCHEANNSKMTAKDCFGCHDSNSRQLLEGALDRRKALTEKPCSHPLKVVDPVNGRSVTQLCLGCHKTVSGYVAMTNIADNQYIEINMAVTHPIGLKPTHLVYPRTLPLSKLNGTINCVTCHDPHGLDRRMRLLRYYYPGNGRPADFRPLCNDCHPDGWMPLKMRRDTIIKDARKHHDQP